jgi:hypothetical protein
MYTRLPGTHGIDVFKHLGRAIVKRRTRTGVAIITYIAKAHNTTAKVRFYSVILAEVRIHFFSVWP